MSSNTQRPSAGPAEGQPDLSGQTLDDFRLLRKLGQGGMGQVYLAEQISLKRNVALKLLRPEMAASTQALARFKLEAEAVARITHPNIVQVYAIGSAAGLPYMALEYVEGRNLKEHLVRKGPPELLVTISIMRQVAAALQRAGELGIIHRDIKPENILLTRKVEVKVADFGLSRMTDDEKPALNLTQSGVTMGTPLYMSPEQVEGKPVDSRTDIYSFGVTAYHMLAGQPPFRGETAFEVALQHVQKQPIPLQQIRPDLPELLCAIVHKMMAKDPAQRYQTGKDLLRDLARLRESLSGLTSAIPQSLLSGESLNAPSLTPAPQAVTQTIHPPPPPRRRLFWATLVGSTLLLAGVGGAGVAWQQRKYEDRAPNNSDVSPTDARTVEAILLPNKREQALRLLVEQTLRPAAGKKIDAAGFGNCLELGVFYLDNNELIKARKLFDELDGIKEPRGYHILGHLGQGIVLALGNKAKESSAKFRAVFAPLQGKPGKGKGRVPPDLAQIMTMAENPRLRYWLGRAMWYNKENGVAIPPLPPALARKIQQDTPTKRPPADKNKAGGKKMKSGREP